MRTLSECKNWCSHLTLWLGWCCLQCPLSQYWLLLQLQSPLSLSTLLTLIVKWPSVDDELCSQISIQTVVYSPAAPGNNSSSCLSQEPVRRVEAECQGREECSLVVTPHNLILNTADPAHCQHTVRRLSVSHQCRPSSLRTRVTCPTASLDLSCRDKERSRLFVMVSSDSGDKESLLHYCGPQARVGGSGGHLTNSSLTSLVVGACHGVTSCQLSLPSPHLVRTVYSCVSLGVINMDMVQRHTTTTTTSTTTTTTTTTSTSTTTTTITSTPRISTSTRRTSVHFTSFQSFTRTKDQKKENLVNESFQNDQIQAEVGRDIQFSV